MGFALKSFCSIKRHKSKTETYRLKKIYIDKEYIVFSSNTKHDIFGKFLETSIRKLTDEGFFVCIVYT